MIIPPRIVRLAEDVSLSPQTPRDVVRLIEAVKNLSTPTLIRSHDDLENLDPDTIITDPDGTVRRVSDDTSASALFPLIVLATGDQVREAQAQLKSVSTPETWKPVPGFGGRYSVSDHGRIKNSRTGEQVAPRIFGSRTSPGVRLRAENGKYKDRTLSRLVHEAFIGPVRGPVTHLDGDKYNASVDNLSSGKVPSKTHCHRGHELISANLRRAALHKGKRECLACDRARSFTHLHPDLADEFDGVADHYFENIRSGITRPYPRAEQPVDSLPEDERGPWKPVPGFESRYAVSAHGRVKNIRYGNPLKPRFNRNDKHGRLQVRLYDAEGKVKARLVARIVYEAFHGPLPNGYETYHINGDVSDVAATNIASRSAQERARASKPQSHCKRGHELTPPNIQLRKKGYRVCSACARARKYIAAHPDMSIGLDALSDHYYTNIMNGTSLPFRDAPLPGAGE